MKIQLLTGEILEPHWVLVSRSTTLQNASSDTWAHSDEPFQIPMQKKSYDLLIRKLLDEHERATDIQAFLGLTTIEPITPTLTLNDTFSCAFPTRTKLRPVEAWSHLIQNGYYVVRDCGNEWYVARILIIDAKEANVHFLGLTDAGDETLGCNQLVRFRHLPGPNEVTERL